PALRYRCNRYTSPWTARALSALYAVVYDSGGDDVMIRAPLRRIPRVIARSISSRVQSADVRTQIIGACALFRWPRTSTQALPASTHVGTTSRESHAPSRLGV